jgi:NTP pyrophosphatase (non-canonical NTP hydrolase)
MSDALSSIRNADDFQARSRRTWGREFHGDDVNAQHLFALLGRVSGKCVQADTIKRALYYGDEVSLGVLPDGDPSCTDLLSDEEANLLHIALGLISEAGEILNAFVDTQRHGEVDKVNLLEEGGDILYYAARLADAADTSLFKMMQANHEKLSARFPDAFDADKAINRNTDAEREILESSSNSAERENE